jgi:hypothetical protein
LNKSAVILAIAAAALDGCSNPPIIDDTRGATMCMPGLAGVGDETPVDVKEVKLPDGCMILHDDNTVQVTRRDVTVITDEMTFIHLCGLDSNPPPGGSGIDWTMVQLLLVRVPDMVGPVWIVHQDSMYTVGENTIACRGSAAHATRYIVEFPAGATVKFFSCPAPSCTGEP